MVDLATESWTWYAFVTVAILFRFTSRIIHRGALKRLQTEDYLMLLIWSIYTVLITFMNVVAHVETNLMLPEEIPTLNPESIQSRAYGSKLVLLVEQCMISTQWGCKLCLLLIYYRLTVGLTQEYVVKGVACYVVFGWLLMEILYFGVWCQPFNQYWAVPVDNIQCSAALHHLIVNAVFNISSDIMMLCIPLPMLISSQLPPLKKIVLCALFGLGTFVILCAALNKYYSFTQPFSPIWTFWYIREASTAILVANMPHCWPLLRRIFNLRAFSDSSDNTPHPNGFQIRMPRSQGPRDLSSISGIGITIASTDDGTWNSNHSRSHEVTETESTDRCNGKRDIGNDVPLKVRQSVEMRVLRDNAGDGQSSQKSEIGDGFQKGEGNTGLERRR